MLKDADFNIVYASGEEEPMSFYLDALMESSSLDLGLGFFSSSGFKALSYGFAYFISQGGTLRLIINDILTLEDKEAIERGLKEPPEKLIENKFVSRISELQKTLSKQDAHFFNCLSWMVSTKKISIIAVTPKNNGVGIAHQKFGIFTDKNSDKVAFTGSANFSESAMFYNLETISCYRSWTNEADRVDYFTGLFRRNWTGQNPSVKIISIAAVKTALSDSFPVKSIDQLLMAEFEMIDSMDSTSGLPHSVKKKLDRLKDKIGGQEINRFRPTVEPRPYQETAINNWERNGYRGFFEMATGTGKTYTGLFASLSLKNSLGKCFLLVLVPTISLAEQWKEEVQIVGLNNILIVSSLYQNWDHSLQQNINAFKLGSVDHVVCISTYDSYKSKRFQPFISKFPKETMLLADEAHTMGASQLLNALPESINYRLGLSATPHRHFDDSGTFKLLQFFNAEYKATYKLDLKEAIAKQFLCQYKLYPHFAQLNEGEYVEYIELSKKIARKAHISNNKFEKTDAGLEKLLRDRRNILNKAEEKLAILGEIIDHLIKTEGEVKHTLVYCPEGNSPEDDARIIDKYGRLLGLEKGLRIGKFVGETPANEREQLLRDFEEGKIQCLLAMKCLDEGVDIKQTKYAIFLSSSTNPRQYIQRRGRVLRTHSSKSFAFLYDIIAVPPDLAEDERLKTVEKTIISQELGRYKEFAEDALNYVEAIEPLKPLLKKYEIEL